MRGDGASYLDRGAAYANACLSAVALASLKPYTFASSPKAMRY